MVIVAFGFVMVGFLVANSVGASFTTVFPSPHISTQGTISYTASTVLQSIMSMAVAIGSARYACLLNFLDIHWSRLSNPIRSIREYYAVSLAQIYTRKHGIHLDSNPSLNRKTQGSGDHRPVHWMKQFGCLKERINISYSWMEP